VRVQGVLSLLFLTVLTLTIAACSGGDDGRDTTTVLAPTSTPARPFSPLAPTRVDPDPQASTTNELTRYLESEVLARVYDSLSRMTGAFSLENCGSPCAVDFDFLDNAGFGTAFCFKALDAGAIRAESRYDPSLHEPLLTELDQACKLISSIDADTPENRQRAHEAFDLLDPLVPDSFRH
jgi:hypothetical protein